MINWSLSTWYNTHCTPRHRPITQIVGRQMLYEIKSYSSFFFFFLYDYYVSV